MKAIVELVGFWREEASALRSRYGDEGKALLLEAVAAEVEAAMATDGMELMDMRSACAFTGYGDARIRCLIKAGRLTNHGEKYRPRLRADQLLAVVGRKKQGLEASSHGRAL
jgi:hypothetical protein